MNTSAITEWLLSCQLADGDLAGGLLDGYDTRRGTYQFVYLETTGYFLTYLAAEHRDAGGSRFGDRLTSTARFLRQTATAYGLPYTIDPRAGVVDRRAFTFDNAIIASGLVDSFGVTGDTAALKLAERIATKLLLPMVRPDGRVRAYRNLTTGAQRHPGEDFSADGTCIHVKDAIAFLKLSAATNRPLYRATAEQLLESARLFQRADGAFTVHAGGTVVFSHAHCYATEGCLYGYLMTRHEPLLDRVRRAADYLVGAQAWTGGIYQYGRTGQTAADATAQAVRIWATLRLIDETPQYDRPVARALRYLGRMQDRRGGIRYTQGRLLGQSPLLYTWVSMFARSAARLASASAPDAHEIY